MSASAYITISFRLVILLLVIMALADPLLFA
jgi:hypothetical protein